MKLAIVGTGIAGMTAAHLLHEEHDLTIFEAGSHIGGHTNTVDVNLQGTTYAIDTGFIVFNDWTYPNFIALLDRLGVASQPSDMSFSVRCEETGLEYNGTTLNSLFAQRRNLLRPSFYPMIRDILRFNRESLDLLDEPGPGPSLGAYLEQNRYSPAFIRRYIVPMAGAIWSAGRATMQEFPARYLVQFFKNHGMLSVDARPTWRVITGGSQRYVEPLVRPFRDRIRLQSPVESISRYPDRVEVRGRDQRGAYQTERFDGVVLACHSDQASGVVGGTVSPGEGDSWRNPLSTERSSVAHGSIAPTETPPGLGGLELSSGAEPAGPCLGHLSHESPSGAERALRFLCDLESHRGDRSGDDPQAHHLPPSGVLPRSDRRAATARGDQRMSPDVVLRGLLGLRFS
jgi:predicted NAD/FAD-binding protein